MLKGIVAWVVFAVGTCLSASAADVPSTLSPSSLSSIKSIGVLSAVADTLSISTNGPFLRASMSQKTRPISDLQIDSALEARLALKLGTRFKAVSISFDREQFSKMEDKPRASVPPLSDLIKTLPASVDAYLLVSKELVPFSLNEDFFRPGLNIGRGGFHEDQYLAEAIVGVSVIDAHTYAVLAKVVYPPPISRLWGGTVETLPLDGSLWPDDAGAFAPQQREGLKRMLTDDLDVVVSKAVTKLGLLP